MSQQHAYRPRVLENLEDRLTLSQTGITGALVHHAHAHAHVHAHAHHPKPHHAMVSPVATPAGAVHTQQASRPAAGNPVIVNAPAALTALASPAAAQSLSTAGVTAAQFKSLFSAIPTAPAMTTSFQFNGAPVSGAVASQAFKGTGAASGLYAYAYQVQVNNVTDSTGQPVAVQGLSWRFNAAPVATSVGEASSKAFVITSGSIGGLSSSSSTPVQITWQADAAGSNTGMLLVQSQNAAALPAGSQTVTFVVITSAAPRQQLVNVQSSSPINPNAYLPVAYAP